MNVLPRVGTEPTALVASSSLEQFPSSSGRFPYGDSKQVREGQFFSLKNVIQNQGYFPSKLEKGFEEGLLHLIFPIPREMVKWASFTAESQKRRAIFYSASALVVERFSLSLPWDRPSKKDLNICVDEITRPSQFTSSSLGLRVLGEIPIFSRSIGRYLPIDRSHLRKSIRAQLALFVDVTRAGRGIARFDDGAAELPYLTNEA